VYCSRRVGERERGKRKCAKVVKEKRERKYESFFGARDGAVVVLVSFGLVMI
jgi:hypothetical protein